MSASCGLKLVTLPTGCGYGDAAAEYAVGLDALGIPVSWHPVRFDRSEPIHKAENLAMSHAPIRTRLDTLWLQPIDYDVFLLDMPPARWHQPLLKKESGKRALTYATWEIDVLPADWAPALNLYERVFVPSEFNRKTFLEHGVTVPVAVVPHIARHPAAVNDGAFLDPVGEDDFVFYTIGVWSTRKALEETIRAYLDAFTADEKVVLVVKTEVVDYIALASMNRRQTSRGPKHIGTTWWTLARILGEYDNPARVHLISQNIPPRDIDHLHTRGDCYVGLTRSEGWGLPSFDALLFGNPVIMPNFSGQADYLGADYPLSVRHEVECTLPAPDDHWHTRSDDAHWAKADPAHATRLMRWVFEHPGEAMDIARERQTDLRARFAPDIVCHRLAELMGFEI